MSAAMSAAELASLRASADAALPDLAAVARLTAAQDGRGGQSQSYATHIASVRARVAPAGGTGREAEEVNARRLGIVAPWVVTLPHGTDVIETDRIGINGMLLEVTLLDARRSDHVSLRVGCKELV